MSYSQGTDFDRVNYAGSGDVHGVPASSRSRIGLRQRHLRRHSEVSHKSPNTTGSGGADQGQSKRSDRARYETTARRESTGRQPGGSAEGGKAGEQQTSASRAQSVARGNHRRAARKCGGGSHRRNRSFRWAHYPSRGHAARSGAWRAGGVPRRGFGAGTARTEACRPRLGRRHEHRRRPNRSASGGLESGQIMCSQTGHSICS